MSEIRVTTLKDTSGGNSSTTEQIASGRAKAWVNFNGVSTVAIRANFNVNSITDNGTGDYTANFTTAMADANFSYALSGKQDGANCGHSSPSTFATGSLRFQTYNVDDTPALRDYIFTSVAIFR